jgi:hypothetical protein
VFVTSFAQASSYAKATADKTAVRRATAGSPVRPAVAKPLILGENKKGRLSHIRR